MDAQTQRRETDDQMAAYRLLQELEPDGTADQDFVEFVKACPSMKAREYTKAVLSSATGKQNRTSWIIHLIRAGKAMTVAKRRATRKKEPEAKPWAVPSPEECEQWDPGVKAKHPTYEPTDGLLANLKRLQDAHR